MWRWFFFLSFHLTIFARCSVFSNRGHLFDIEGEDTDGGMDFPTWQSRDSAIPHPVGTSDDQHLAPPTGAVTSDEGYNLFQPSRIIELPFPFVHLRSQEQSHVNAVSSTGTGQASTSVHSRHDDQRMAATSDRMAENLNSRSRMYNLAGLASESHTEATVNPRAYREAKVDPHFISVMSHHYDSVFMALESGRPEHPSTTGIFFRQIGPEVDEVRDLRRLSISLTTQAAPRIENSTNGKHNEIYFKIDQHTPAYVFSNAAAYFIIMEGSFYFGAKIRVYGTTFTVITAAATAVVRAANHVSKSRVYVKGHKSEYCRSPPRLSD